MIFGFRNLIRNLTHCPKYQIYTLNYPTAIFFFLGRIFSGGGVEDTRPRTKTQKNPRPRTALQRTKPLKAKDRHARGRGPRTQAKVFSQKKVFKIFFRRSPKEENKKGLRKFSARFLAFS